MTSGSLHYRAQKLKREAKDPLNWSLGLAIIAIAAHFTPKILDDSDKQNLGFLANGLAQNSLNLSLEAGGKVYDLKNPNLEPADMIKFLEATGQIAVPGKLSPANKELKINIASIAGEPICSIQVPADRFKLLLQGNISEAEKTSALQNIEKLGKICGFSDEQIETMKIKSRIGTLRSEAEKPGPYSVVSEGVAVGQIQGAVISVAKA